LKGVPVFEFRCRACDERFEELVGSHVGKTVADVRCPECGEKDVEKLAVSGFASTQHQLTPKQKKRMEDKRGIDRGGAKERFKAQRAAERRHHQRGRGG
jgi:putative FmdB family regulatory protein